MSLLSDSLLRENSVDNPRADSYRAHRKPTWANSIDDSHKGKRKNIECSSIRISIPSVSTASHKPGEAPYTVFVLDIFSGVSEWTIQRRYSDFHYLHSQLSKYVKEEMPALPSKRFLGSSTDAAFVEERRIQLEKYIRNLILLPSVWTRNDVIQFLDNSTNTLLFMWNFERMRKMQEMLGNMTYENKNITEKLSGELTQARDEVAVLKDRISQMEMLFLQQAAGVAERQLSTHDLRTLSGVRNENDANQFSYDLSTQIPNHRVAFDPNVVMNSTMSPEEILEVLKLSRMTIGRRQSEDTIVTTNTVGDLSYASGLTVERDSRADLTIIQQKMISMSLQLQDAVMLSNELLEEKIQFISENNHGEGGAGTHNSSYYDYQDEENSILDETAMRLILDLHEVDKCARSVACSYNWIHRLFDRFDELVAALIPTESNVQERQEVVDYARDIVSKSLGAQLFSVGSFLSRTFLPEADVDLSAFMCPGQDEGWFVRVNEAFCMCSMYEGIDTKRITVRNVSFVNAEVKIVKGMINNIEVDISSNQICALYAQGLVDLIDSFVKQSHLFKRSILLIKAWCKFESVRYNSGAQGQGGIAGARGGRLSTWTIIVMIIWIFNKYGATIINPLQALIRFLDYFSDFDWNKCALTVLGPVSSENLSEMPNLDKFYTLNGGSGFLGDDLLKTYRQRYENTKASAMQAYNDKNSKLLRIASNISENSDGNDANFIAAQNATVMLAQQPVHFTGLLAEEYYRRGIVTVIDPIQPKANISRSVDVAGFNAIKYIFKAGKHALLRMCGQCEKCPVVPPTIIPNPFDSTSIPCGSLDSLENTAESTDVDDDTQNVKANPKLFLTTFSGQSSSTKDHSLRDTPYIQSFMESTIKFIKGLSYRPNITNTSTTCLMKESLYASNQYYFTPLQASNAELELSMKHAELILGCVLTPQAVARVIVYVIENRGPLPVGEIGKLLQEVTGNENLATSLKNQYKGLKKVIEGYPLIFQVGIDHPFNPLVGLTSEFVMKSKNNSFTDEELDLFFTFEVIQRPNTNPNTAPGSPTSSVGGKEFIPLGKHGKAQSHRDTSYSQTSYQKEKEKRSGSFSLSTAGTSNQKRNDSPSSDMGSAQECPSPGSSFSSSVGGQYMQSESTGRAKNNGKNVGRSGGGGGGRGSKSPAVLNQIPPRYGQYTQNGNVPPQFYGNAMSPHQMPMPYYPYGPGGPGGGNMNNMPVQGSTSMSVMDSMAGTSPNMQYHHPQGGIMYPSYASMPRPMYVPGAFEGDSASNSSNKDMNSSNVETMSSPPNPSLMQGQCMMLPPQYAYYQVIGPNGQTILLPVQTGPYLPPPNQVGMQMQGSGGIAGSSDISPATNAVNMLQDNEPL